MRILKEMKRSSLGLDLYMWLSYKTYILYSQKKKPERLKLAEALRPVRRRPRQGAKTDILFKTSAWMF